MLTTAERTRLLHAATDREGARPGGRERMVPRRCRHAVPPLDPWMAGAARGKEARYAYMADTRGDMVTQIPRPPYVQVSPSCLIKQVLHLAVHNHHCKRVLIMPLRRGPNTATAAPTSADKPGSHGGTQRGRLGA